MFRIDYRYLDQQAMDAAYAAALAEAQAAAPPEARGEVVIPPPDPADFIDLNIWFHGFYARADADAGMPTRCSSCLIPHEPVYAGTWYSYESANLLELIPDAQRPVSILRVRMYASGHEYDVYIGDVALYAE